MDTLLRVPGSTTPHSCSEEGAYLRNLKLPFLQLPLVPQRVTLYITPPYSAEQRIYSDSRRGVRAQLEDVMWAFQHGVLLGLVRLFVSLSEIFFNFDCALHAAVRILELSCIK